MRGIPSPPFFAQAEVSPDQLYDIVVLAPDVPVWPTVLYTLVALLVAGALAFAVWYFLSARRSPSKDAGALARAAARIREIELKHDELSPNQFAIELSDTLKDFLSETFSDPVRFETTQEFLARIGREETRLPQAAQHELMEFLNAAEEIKFGNAPGSEDMTPALLHRAKALLHLCRTINSER
jgi:hypothetical protein